MTCTEVEQIVDAFVDAELPGPMLLEVARHAGSCAKCDDQIRALTELQEAVAHTIEAEVAQLDLGRVWAAVDARLGASPMFDRVVPLRRWPTPLVGLALAAAAGLFFWLRAPETRVPTPAGVATTVRHLPNQAFIDRLDTVGAHLGVRREPKAGTTIIWVSADGEQ